MLAGCRPVSGGARASVGGGATVPGRASSAPGWGRLVVFRRGRRWGDHFAGRSRSRVAPRPRRRSNCPWLRRRTRRVRRRRQALGRAVVPKRELLKSSLRSSTRASTRCAGASDSPGRSPVAAWSAAGRTADRRPAGLRLPVGARLARGLAVRRHAGDGRAVAAPHGPGRGRPPAAADTESPFGRFLGSVLASGAGAAAASRGSRRSSPWPDRVCAPRRAARSVWSLPSAPAAPVRGRAVGRSSK